MLRYEELEQLSADRTRQLRAEGEAERRAARQRRSPLPCRRDRTMLTTFQLLLRPRRAT